MDELLQKCAPGAAAKWGLCVLLFTSKATTAPMFTALANQFHGKVAFGEVRPKTLSPTPPRRLLSSVCHQGCGRAHRCRPCCFLWSSKFRL